MTQVTPTDHQMVRSLRALVKSMEQLSDKTGIPVNRLWDAYKNPNVQLKAWGAKLAAYYRTKFPEPEFDPWIERRDRKLQDAFQLAIAAEPRRDRSKLRELFEDDWTWLSAWVYDDRAGERYLRARYALTSGWADARLSPDISREATLELAENEGVLCLEEINNNPQRPFHQGLKQKAAKVVISARQRLHLLKHNKHLPLTQAIDRAELEPLLGYLLTEIESWPVNHFNRWQWARDAVTISSGLTMKDECSRAYEILLDERPAFANLDHHEWTIGPAANDPDLRFLRQNYEEICNLIMERKTRCAA
jgi:hypothetical protein